MRFISMAERRQRKVQREIPAFRTAVIDRIRQVQVFAYLNGTRAELFMGNVTCDFDLSTGRLLAHCLPDNGEARKPRPGLMTGEDHAGHAQRYAIIVDSLGDMGFYEDISPGPRLSRRGL